METTEILKAIGAGYLANILAWSLIAFYVCVMIIPPMKSPKFSKWVRTLMVLATLVPFLLPAGICAAGLLVLLRHVARIIVAGECDDDLSV